MGRVKETIKKMLGEKFSQQVSIYKKYFKSVPKILTKKTLIFNKEKINEIKVYELKNKNVFCGYYDLEPIKDNKMLVHVCDKDINNTCKPIELGYFDINNGKYRTITYSNAWCWQQGSRLRWSNIEKNVIFFNDVENGQYCFKKYNIEKNEVIKCISYPVYDMDKYEKYGISINFSRLQRLRPGYGYDYLKDETINQNAPDDDGIFVVDLENNTKKMLISLKQLALLIDKDMKFQHYINHISFSPNGKKIMFFHLWTDSISSDWRNELCVINIDGSDFIVLENVDIVSHYDWKNDNEILVTGIKNKTKEEFYRYYNVELKKYREINNEYLKKDGHPIHTLDLKRIYSDTYPNSNCMQTLFEYNFQENKYTFLLDLFANPRLILEKRCDLHPKLIKNKDIILVDTTFKKCKRSVVLIKLKKRK